MGFESRSTSDGWTYGKGTYEKKIADYLGVKAPNYNEMVTVPASLAGALSAGLTTAVQIAGTTVASVLYSKVSHITIPTYYIFATSPSGVKTVAEWPLAETTRDYAYGLWSSAFPAIPTSSKQKFVSDLNYKAPPVSMSSIMAGMKGEVDLYFDVKRGEIRRDVVSASAGTVIAVLAAAAIGYLLLRR